jgi:glycosyltransferase involved in cell wall biosynthesis
MVSLVMTTYNGSEYLIEQLDSIRKQTVQPDDVIICDDCSMDESYKMVKDYIYKYNLQSWSVYLNEKNKGYSLNFGDAIKMSKGDIIFLADQDDIWFEDKIEGMLKVMNERPEIDLLASNVVPFYMGKDPRPVSYEKFSGKEDVIRIRNKSKWIKPARPGCSMCLRKKLIEHYDDLWFAKYPHDCLIWGLAVLSESAYLYNKDTIKFRRHDKNASSRADHKNGNRVMSLQQEIQICKKMMVFANKGNFGDDVCKLLKKQHTLYQKRLNTVKKRDLVGVIGLLPSLKYYSRNRYWLTDIYYCLKN